MGLSSRDFCAAKLRVLSDPTRLAVMRMLGRAPRVVGELVAALGIEQSLLSHHLRVLREAGLVRSESEGQCRRYSIVSPGKGSNAVDLGCCHIQFHD